ncbi:hypothetical protein FNH22_08675 [Fulvivirga sp. M361]|uniref:DUF6798 domain-containing protein n=1 Tax=Fulvivirga sp. M361 TaxID=2594266 RepID=UPI00117A9AAB|nr:DUF6798 domain-containing protein [Fulvivirga sp. M361]TRX60113.1 hypothetical protein FNH22_08675 [Fulvivirga sp. M361]
MPNFPGLGKENTFLFLLALTYVAGYSLNPIYNHNQNTYFLHGLANGGLGHLSHDWMLSTKDPFPLFSALISFTYSYLSPAFFYLYFLLALGVFIITISKITSDTVGIKTNSSTFMIFFVIVTLLSSGALRSALPTTGEILLKGLADQYILGTGLLPSTFGLLLLISIYTFLKNKLYISILTVISCCYLHSTYLLSSGLIIFSYMLVLYTEKEQKKSLVVGLVSSVLIAPLVVYNALTFLNHDEQVTNTAREILINYRFPHHAKVMEWFDMISTFKILVVLITLWFTRNKRIFPIILIPSIGGILLTLLQVFTESNFLALLFPWRVSVIIMPLCTFLLIGTFVKKSNVFVPENNKSRNYKLSFLLLFIIIIASSGFFVTYLKFERYKEENFSEITDYLELSKTEGDLYLIPIHLNEFRLRTGACVFIDNKSHPYESQEIITWYERVKIAKAFYLNNSTCHHDMIPRLKHEYNVTHIVDQRPHRDCEFLKEVYRDDNYFIYKIDLNDLNNS